jgi:hypothetical protein
MLNVSKCHTHCSTQFAEGHPHRIHLPQAHLFLKKGLGLLGTKEEYPMKVAT